jgi:hypothetical protein
LHRTIPFGRWFVTDKFATNIAWPTLRARDVLLAHLPHARHIVNQGHTKWSARGREQMKPHVRAMVAGTAIAHATGAKVSGVHAHGSGHVALEVSVSAKRVEGYDHANSCQFCGDLPHLYHHGQSAHVEFRPDGDSKYSGYDYDESCQFEVAVTGTDATVYDLGVGSYFHGVGSFFNFSGVMTTDA